MGTVALQGHRLVVETDDFAGTLLLVAVDKTNHITQRHFVAAQPLRFLLSNLHVGTVQVDRCIGQNPAHRILQVQHDDLFAAHLQHLPAFECVGPQIEILHRLTHFQTGLYGLQPTRLVQSAVNRGA